jgi:3,4-dihydroxy 2-butanone 4-phosphate synthase/GTP cyclohydrolase II
MLLSLTETSYISSIDECIEDLRSKKMLIIFDTMRENEGDIFIPAEIVIPDDINFMLNNARGCIVVSVTSDIARRLDFKLINSSEKSDNVAPFAYPVDLRHGITTGVSVIDRVKTIRAIIDHDSKASDFVIPGHVQLVIAKDNGIFDRAGHTEAYIELSRFSGYKPVGVGCEILNKDGCVANFSEIIEFAKKFNVKITTIAKIIEYRRKNKI